MFVCTIQPVVSGKRGFTVTVIAAHQYTTSHSVPWKDGQYTTLFHRVVANTYIRIYLNIVKSRQVYFKKSPENDKK